MAKFLKITSALFVVLIVTYLGAHYWIRWKNTVHDDVTKVSSLVDCEPNDVKAIAITQQADGKTEELEFERLDQPVPGTPTAVSYAQADWRYLKPSRGEADATLLRRISSTVCELYDPVLLAHDDAGNLAPAESRSARFLKILLKGKAGERKLSFRFSAPGADRMVTVSAELDGVTRAAKIPPQLLQAASLSPEQYQSLQVMRTDADNIQTATLRIDGKERFTLERLGADWKLLEQGKDKGPASEEANRFVNRLSTLKALGVMEPSYGADRCRASAARAVFDVRGVAGREESVRFDYGRGGEIAVCSTARTMKFRVHRDLLKYLDVSAKSLATK
jgi:hypothetical protein